MATATATRKQTPEQASLESGPQFDLEYLVAQRKQLDDAIKAARAALPKQTPLDKELARQASTPERNHWLVPFFAKYVAKRVALGQTEADAIAGVTALLGDWLRANPPTADAQ